MIEIVAMEGALPPDLRLLAPAAAAEGIRTIDVVLDEWETDKNRFSRSGEALLVARVDGELAGIGGMTRDRDVAEALRMRRFYILPDFRRLGLGRTMAERLLASARDHTRLVTLRAGSQEAGRFWERLGFVAVPLETHTHEMRF